MLHEFVWQPSRAAIKPLAVLLLTVESSGLLKEVGEYQTDGMSPL